MKETENVRSMGDIQWNCPLWSYHNCGKLRLVVSEDG